MLAPFLLLGAVLLPRNRPPVGSLVGRPAITPPKSRGLGTRLTERSLAHELDGQVSIAFNPGGVVYTIDAPLA